MLRTSRLLTSLTAVIALTTAPFAAPLAQESPFYELPDLVELQRGGMRDVIEHYSEDLRALRRFWDVSLSPQRTAQERAFWEVWRKGLDDLDFDALVYDDQIDWLLLQNRIGYEFDRLALDAQAWEETAELLPFADGIISLQEARRRVEPLNAQVSAGRLHEMVDVVKAVRARVCTVADDERESADGEGAPIVVDRLVANRAASHVRSLQRTLSSWFRYFDGYDPLFGWWCAGPYEELDEELKGYAKFLREKIAGVDEDDTDTILGDPIGADALQMELARELIPYTAAELVEIANREFEWCDAEMLRASRDLGFGDDWRAALEHVKGLHVDPGDQPRLIVELAHEAVDFLEERDLLTIPTLAKNIWRLEMMSPARQKFTPYFTGGEVISVSFPTGEMAHEDKLMSLRGNNVHFSRATVHHELIPGHHLQGFMNSRYMTHRGLFSTPFWLEGWALYWEMQLWDLDFQRSAEDRVGMLFWRRHRCARIIFSLGYHLGDMTSDECIDFLVERVGHERRNATAEVRRSIQGGYGPLYQAAYMLGGLQFRALHAELVESGRMTNRDFHDAILHGNSIPIELIRAQLLGTRLTPDFQSTWRFYDK